VLSGISTEADVEQTGIRPDWTFRDMANSYRFGKGSWDE